MAEQVPEGDVLAALSAAARDAIAATRSLLDLAERALADPQALGAVVALLGGLARSVLAGVPAAPSPAGPGAPPGPGGPDGPGERGAGTGERGAGAAGGIEEVPLS